MVPATLLSTLLLALAVAANPTGLPNVVVRKSLVTLPFSRSANFTSLRNIVLHDQARARVLIHGAESDGISVHNDAVINSPATNQANSYIASIGVGNPPTTYNLIIDTGSSNTWIGATKAFAKTSTSSQTSNSVSVKYGTGSFSGTEFIDQVTIGNGLVISKQSIGVASTFDGVDGILGIGPVDLTVNTLSPDTSSSIPTVTDNLFSAGTISANEIGVSFEPITDSSGRQTNGEITWGGTDSSKFTGEITFAPITSTSRANRYWGIDQSITYGKSTTILDNSAGIVDTGTTLILLATEAFNKYVTATGAVPDSATNLLKITSQQFSNLQSLFFNVNGVSFELIPNAQIWPRSLNTLTGGVAGDVYLIVGDLKSKVGSGLDFISGQAFLERFYSVYDTANKRVGLATTPFTTATTN